MPDRYYTSWAIFLAHGSIWQLKVIRNFINSSILRVEKHCYLALRDLDSLKEDKEVHLRMRFFFICFIFSCFWSQIPDISASASLRWQRIQVCTTMPVWGFPFTASNLHVISSGLLVIFDLLVSASRVLGLQSGTTRSDWGK